MVSSARGRQMVGSPRLNSDSDSDSKGEDTGNSFDNGLALKELFSQKIALMFVFVPAAWIVHLTTNVEEQAMVNFAVNLLAIVPLAWLISECTEHAAESVGKSWGVFLNSTFGNIVEIIMSIQAITHGEPGTEENLKMLKIVQASLLGAILMNLLFVLGCCFLVVGIAKKEFQYNSNLASYNLSLLAVCSFAIVIPTAVAEFDQASTSDERLSMSRGIAVILILMYMQWLFFQMSTHASYFEEQKIKKASRISVLEELEDISKDLKGDIDPRILILERRLAYAERHLQLVTDDDEEEEDEEPGVFLTLPVATFLLLVATVAVSFQCDFLVEAIGPVTEQYKIKKAFVATVILPMVGNFSEEIAAVSIASKGKIDMAMGVCISSASQIALFAIPCCVLIAAALNRDLDLDFEVFQVKMLAMVILVLSICLQDGKANWLKGSMLISAYVILAGAFLFIHDEEFDSFGVDVFDSILKDGEAADKLKELLGMATNETDALVQ